MLDPFESPADLLGVAEPSVVTRTAEHRSPLGLALIIRAPSESCPDLHPGFVRGGRPRGGDE